MIGDAYYIIRWEPTTFGRQACAEPPTAAEEAIDFAFAPGEFAVVEAGPSNERTT